jgi:hypothetical protein
MWWLIGARCRLSAETKVDTFDSGVEAIIELRTLETDNGWKEWTYTLVEVVE